MNSIQTQAIKKPVTSMLEMQKAWQNPRKFLWRKGKAWDIIVVVAKRNGEENKYDWTVIVRLRKMSRKTYKAISLWTEEESEYANRILVNELSGVGRIVSSREQDGDFYRMMTRELTEEETQIIWKPAILGH